MNDTKEDIPAFPLQDAAAWQYGGMSLRDYFAAKAMQGILASIKEDDIFTEGSIERCYRIADMMLEERSKKNER